MFDYNFKTTGIMHVRGGALSVLLLYVCFNRATPTPLHTTGVYVCLSNYPKEISRLRAS